MNAVLAIGNAMNVGTYKGSASGFRLSSLTKLNQTKSTIGSVTLLDYLIQVLYRRQESGDKSSTMALAFDDELSAVSDCKLISLSELEKDLRNLYQDGQLLTQIIQNEANNISSTICDETTQWTEENIKELTLISDNIINEISKGQDKLNVLKMKITELENYFGESQSSSSTIFINLDEFLVVFRKAKDKYQIALKKEKLNNTKTSSQLSKSKK